MSSSSLDFGNKSYYIEKIFMIFFSEFSMANGQISKIRKQAEQTLNQLHKRLIALPEAAECLFSNEVWGFLTTKANAISANMGYLVASIIATCAYVAGLNARIHSNGHEMAMNIFCIFIGRPGTGKSQVLKECAEDSINAICAERGIDNLGVHKCTPSGK